MIPEVNIRGKASAASVNRVGGSGMGVGMGWWCPETLSRYFRGQSPYLSIRIHPTSYPIFPPEVVAALLSGSRKSTIRA